MSIKHNSHIIVGFIVGFLLLLMIGTVSAETGEPHMDQTWIYAYPGDDIQFTYSVPEGFQVISEAWDWEFYFEANQMTYSITDHESDAYITWLGHGRMRSDIATMVHVFLTLNDTVHLESFALIYAPESAFTYEVHDGGAVITGRDDAQLSRWLLIPPTLGGFPVTAIGDGAFLEINPECRYITMPDTVISLGDDAFGTNPWISAVHVSENLTSMGKRAFRGCFQMTKINIPDSLLDIPEEAFSNCWMLGQMEFADVKDIQDYIGRNVRSIGARAYVACLQIGTGANDVLPSTLTSIGEGAFSGCENIESLVVPAEVTVIPDNAFQNCSALSSITFEGHVSHIGISAFQNCSRLSSFNFGNDLTFIGDDAFRGCASLQNAVFPAALDYIGLGAFRDCESLTGFTVDAENNSYLAIGGALMTKDQSRLLCYAPSAPAEEFSVPSAMNTADDGAFHHARQLKRLVLSDGFIDYRNEMFYDATGIEEIFFPQGTLTELKDGFFYGCTSLMYPNAYTGIVAVGKNAFFNCASMQSLSFDSALESVGDQAFMNCVSLASVTLPDEIETFGFSAFRGDTSLNSFTLPSSLTEIPGFAFTDCTALETIQWNETLTAIQANAFQNTGLTEGMFPDSLVSIGSGAFSGAASLTGVTLPEGLVQIGSTAFASTGIEAVWLPESLTALGSGAFMHCFGLASVHLNSSLTELPTSAFEDCPALTEINLPDGLEILNERALMGTGLTEIELPNLIQRVGSKAFANCFSLTSALIWPELEVIEADAFSGCGELTISGWPGTRAEEVALDNQIPFISCFSGLTFTLNSSGNGYLISGCDPNAYSITIPATHDSLPVTGLADGAFSACTSLKYLYVDEDSDAFIAEDGILYSATGNTLVLYPAHRTGITFTIPARVTAIAPYALAGTRNLRMVYIGAQVTAVGNHSFENAHEALCLFVRSGSAAEAYALAAGIRHETENTQFTYRVANGQAIITGYVGTAEDVYVPEQIDGYPVFSIENLGGGTADIRRIFLPDSLKRIEAWGINNLHQLREISFGQGLEYIGAYGLCYLSVIRTLRLPDSLTVIEELAFAGDEMLESLTIPAQVASIGQRFLSECRAIQHVFVAEGNQNYDLQDGLLYENNTETLLWSEPSVAGTVTVRDGTKVIAAEVFKGNGNITAVILPDSLTKIGNNAFAGTAIESIDLPESVTELVAAFFDCRRLTHVTLPSGVTVLNGTFQWCTALEEIVIPQSVTAMYNTFDGCTALKRVELPDHLTCIAGTVFNQCDSLTSLHLPASLERMDAAFPASLQTITVEPGSIRYVSESGILYDTEENTILFVNKSVSGEVIVRNGIVSIQDKAFAGNTRITQVELPETCTEIGDMAFQSCTGLQKIILPETLIGIGDSVFQYCSSLQEIAFPESLTYIGRRAFGESGLTNLTVSSGSLAYIGPFAFEWCASLTQIEITVSGIVLGEYAFNHCEALKTAVLPQSIGRWEGGLFRGCSSLESVILPQNITFVHGFEGCTSLQSINIPDSVVVIADNAFKDCTALTSVRLPAGLTRLPYGVFQNCVSLTDIVLPETLEEIGDLALCKVPVKNIVIPAGVKKIGSSAFASNDALESVVFPEGLTEIGYHAFAYAGHITAVSLPESLQILGAGAFHQTPLLSVSIPGHVNTIGAGAFSQCHDLHTVYVSEGVERIENDAFTGCTSLTEVTLPQTIKYIGFEAFCGDVALERINGDPVNVEVIGDYTFAYCSALETLNITDGLREIGERAFYGCLKLRRLSPDDSFSGLYLPHIESISNQAFFGIGPIEQIELGHSLRSLGNNVFYKSSLVTSLYLPDSLTEIGQCVLGNMGLTSIRLPAGMTEIPWGMFSETYGLETLSLPDTVETIGFQAFYGNTSLGALVLPSNLRRIEGEAFAYSKMKLLIPSTVDYIADDAFLNASVEFYTPADSYAAAYAESHGIAVCLNGTIPNEYLMSGSDMARMIVQQVITDDMTIYQKAEALVDWMLDNVILDDNEPDTVASKEALIHRRTSRWGWSFGYKALLTAAGIPNDVYFTAGGFIASKELTDTLGGLTVTYFDGEAVNMIRIGDEWYFTHPAFTNYFGKAKYFMLNRERYIAAFGDNPNVPDCDGYEQTYLYQEFSKDIEQDVSIYAGEQFESGKKLVYAEVPAEDIPYFDVVLDYAGMHMDTLTWNNAEGEFEPVIIGTDSGYWLSDDLTGEYAEVILPDAIYPYGDALDEVPDYSAVLCGLNVEGTFIFEEEAPVVARSLKSVHGADEGLESINHIVTATKTYQVTFVPILSQYIDTLEPTVFSWTVQCQLPLFTDTLIVEGNNLVIAMAEDHVFVKNGQLVITFTPMDGDLSEAVHVTIEDSEDLYDNGVQIIPIPVEELRCGSQYKLSISRLAEGFVPSESVWIDQIIVGGHRPAIAAIIPATADSNGTVGPMICADCGETLEEAKTILASRILFLPASIGHIDQEAFYGAAMMQVTIPAGTKSIGSMAFAKCEQLQLVVIPMMQISIADDAFADCSQVTLMILEGSDAQTFAQSHNLGFFIMQE